ncbi:MAG TPA: rRNA maturation RNase YbeY [Gaiellales bacterium]|nr:rRNA maturation RNase YbeY [Gaiellales bacterium]
MTVAVEVRNRARIPLDGPAAAAVLAAAFAAEGVTEGEVGLAVVGRSEMARLNDEHRGKPAPTDVLSFPLDMRDPLPGGVPRQLGDVVICPAVAAAQGTPIEHLLVHGALHLLGWDHEADEGEMLARQAQIVQELEARAARPA